MGPPSYMRSVVDRNVVIRCISVITSPDIIMFYPGLLALTPYSLASRQQLFGETHCLHKHVTLARKSNLFEYSYTMRGH